MQPAAVVELLSRDGRVRQVQRLGRWPARIGRSPACEIVLDDAHLAPEHAELHWTADGARLKLLDSRNGGALAGQPLLPGADVALPLGGGFQLAGSFLRLRTSADALAPEQALSVQPRRHWALLPALLLLMLALSWVDRWSAVDPDARWFDYAAPVLGPLAVVLAWAGLWSLASQLFQHRFPFASHLRAVVGVVVGLEVFEWLLPLVAHSLDLPRLMALGALLLPVAGAALVAWHARQVWPGAQRILGGGITVLLLLGLGLQAANRQEQQFLFGPPYLASLPPPALRLAGPKPPEALIEALRGLEPELSRQARKDNEAAESDD